MGISNISDDQKLQEAYDSFVKKFTKSQKIANPDGDNNEAAVRCQINNVLKNAAEAEEIQAKEGSENQDSNIANTPEARPCTKMLAISNPDMPANRTPQLAEQSMETFPNGKEISIVDVELVGVYSNDLENWV